MSLLIEAVLPARFPTWVRQRPFSVLFLGQGATVRRPRLTVYGLEMSFPARVQAGWMSSDTVPTDAWWERHWRTELGPYGRGAAPASGVYLFHLGRVAGYHPGTAHAGTEATWHQVREYLSERIRLKASQGDDGTEWTRSTRDEAGGGREAPPPQLRFEDADPYEVLEVDPGASDDVVKKAFRTALKLNHPDKCQQLSRQIQEFARERTQLIIAAWEDIKDARGIR